MRKSTIIKIITMSLALVLVLSLVGCGPSVKLKDSVGEFVAKANELDFDGMFELMDPGTLQAIRGNKTMDKFLEGKSTEEIAEAIVKRLVPQGVEDPVQFLKTMSIKYESSNIRDNFAAFFANVTYVVNGQSIEKKIVINMFRKNVSEPWKIKDIAI